MILCASLFVFPDNFLFDCKAGERKLIRNPVTLSLKNFLVRSFTGFRINFLSLRSEKKIVRKDKFFGFGKF